MLSISAYLAVGLSSASPARLFGWAAGYGLVCILLMRARGLYDFHLGASVVSELGRITAATAVTAMLIVSARVFLFGSTHAGQLSARLWLYSTILLLLARAGIALEAQRMWRHAIDTRPTLVVGAGRVGRLVARRLRDRPDLGLQPVGHVDDEPRPASDDDLPVLGRLDDLAPLIATHRITHVVITFSLSNDLELLEVMRRCKTMGTEVLVVPRLYEEMTQRLTIEHVGGVPLIRVAQPDPGGWQFAIKYAIDRVVAALLLVLLAPLLALIALLILVFDGTPILFRQERLGRDGRQFKMLKFRSMWGKPDQAGEGDANWAAAIRGDRPGGAPASADRVTRVGRVLRKTSLDELPQLLNVLRGEMSIVGPRPERSGYAQEFTNLVYRYGERHRVKSGITGWAQVQQLRGETSLADRVEWDNFYIENWSLGLDLKILLMTFPVVLLSRYQTHGPDGSDG
ncbi:MAG: sugar transferase [Solirubrobacteraceae bacterium]